MRSLNDVDADVEAQATAADVSYFKRHPGTQSFYRGLYAGEALCAQWTRSYAPFCKVERGSGQRVVKHLCHARYPREMEPATVSWALDNGDDPTVYFAVADEDEDL